MRILVRLPNWLGDVVMSTGLLQALRAQYPTAQIDVIIKKELVGLASLLPHISQVWAFSKKEFPGLRGVWRFGKNISRQQAYDLCFCLPESFSAALLACAAGAKVRIGYRNEGRAWLLTQAYKKPVSLHRAEEYTYLLERFTQRKQLVPKVGLQVTDAEPTLADKLMAIKAQPYLVANFNSEAQSRRMPVSKAAQIIRQVQTSYTGQIVLVGSAKEAAFVQEIEALLPEKSKIVNIAGKTSLPELADLLQGADFMISTDSGPAHLAAGLRTRLVVFFGAGNEASTAPYNSEFVRVVRVENLACARCLSNTCRFGVPHCLLLLDENVILEQIKDLLRQSVSSG